MDGYSEARQWYGIIAHYPAWVGEYHERSVSVEFDQMNEEYRRLLGRRTLIHNPDREWRILEQLSEYRDVVGVIRDDEQLIVQGHGIYIPQSSGDIEFLDEVSGVSGEFKGYTLNAVPSLNDILGASAQRELTNRTLLSIELGEYVIHQLDGIQLLSDGDVISLPIHTQDMVVLRHMERYVG